MNAKEILIRAAKTFVQAFLAYIAAGVLTVTNYQTGRALVIAALAAAVSAVWNVVVSSVKS